MFQAWGPSSPVGRALYWLCAKCVLWLGLAGLALGAWSMREWTGRYRKNLAWVAVLAGLWIAGDAALCSLSVKPFPAPFSGTAWQALNALVVAPLFEELLFRGIMWTRCAAKLTLPRTWFFCSLAFALLHVPGWVVPGGFAPARLVQFALVVLAGVAFGAGRALTGSVWPAVGFHFVNNLWATGSLHWLLRPEGLAQ